MRNRLTLDFLDDSSLVGPEALLPLSGYHSNREHDHDHGEGAHNHDDDMSDIGHVCDADCDDGCIYEDGFTTDPSYTLPADIEAAHNSGNKPTKTTLEAADQIIRANFKWDDLDGPREINTPGIIEWSFRATMEPVAEGETQDYGRVDLDQMNFINIAIGYFETVANVTFNRIGQGTTGEGAFSDDADVLFQSYLTSGGGWASTGYSRYSGETIWTATGSTVSLGGLASYQNEDDYGMSITLHEIGHALGLSHPGDYNGGGSNYTDDAEYFEDSRMYSVMSYWSATNTGGDHFEWVWQDGQWNAVGGYATNFLLHDLAALHALYGANDSAYDGDTTYGFNSNTGDASWTLSNNLDSIIAAVWDTGGIDTLDVSGFDVSSNLDLREEAFSSFGYLTYNFSIAAGVIIENAIGGGSEDVIIGNAADNVLIGNAGDDTLNGAEGNDTLRGGTGSDTLSGGSGDDVIYIDVDDVLANVSGGADFDTLYFVTDAMTAATASLDFASLGFEAYGIVDSNEVVTATITNDGAGNLTVTGISADNMLTGADGDDTLIGAGGDDRFVFDGTVVSFDTIAGGIGNDTVDYSDYGFAIWVDMQLSVDVFTRGSGTLTSGAWQNVAALTGVENIITTAFADNIKGDTLDNVFSFVGVQAGEFDRFNGHTGSDRVDFGIYDQAVWVDMAFNGLEAWTRGGETITSGTWQSLANFVSIEDIGASAYQDQILGTDDANVFFYLDNAGSFAAFDRYNGRDGIDTVSFEQSSTAVWVDLGVASGIEAWTRGGADVASGAWEQIANLENFENLTGTNFDDYLSGDAGNNVLAGGAGEDVFVFKGAWGDDVVTDFTEGEDTLDFSALGIDFADINVADNGSGDAVITYNGFSVTLNSVNVTDITADDFLF